MKPKTKWAPSQAISVRLAGLAVVVAASLVALLPAAAAARTRTAISFSNTRQVVSVTPGPGTTFYTVSTEARSPAARSPEASRWSTGLPCTRRRLKRTDTSARSASTPS